MSDAHLGRREGATMALPRPAAPTPIPVRIRVIGSRATPEEIILRKEPRTIGAGSEAHIIIEDPAVSRAHAEISLVPEGVRVRDLGSRNGTHYQGHRVDGIVLTLGSRFRIGKTEVLIDPAPELYASEGEGLQRYGDLIAASAAMRQLLGTLRKIEGSVVNVLIQGESGTGKELIARAIHEHSPRASGRMVVVNCGAISRELVRSELFGHRRGAFTGATDSTAGAFEAADCGTLFLDEVGELPLDVQPVLLRALEEGCVTRVGETSPRAVDVRLLAATHRDLEDEVRAARFREDLYYRLHVVCLRVPPLRSRLEDIELLARHFANVEGVPELTPEIVAELQRRPWPGNVRQLRNAVQAFAAVGTLPPAARKGNQSIETALAEMIDLERPYTSLKDELLEAFTKTYLSALLDFTGGNITEAARLSGLQRSYLGKLAQKLGVRKK